MTKSAAILWLPAVANSCTPRCGSGQDCRRSMLYARPECLTLGPDCAALFFTLFINRWNPIRCLTCCFCHCLLWKPKTRPRSLFACSRFFCWRCGLALK